MVWVSLLTGTYLMVAFPLSSLRTCARYACRAASDWATSPSAASNASSTPCQAHPISDMLT